MVSHSISNRLVLEFNSKLFSNFNFKRVNQNSVVVMIAFHEGREFVGRSDFLA